MYDAQTPDPRWVEAHERAQGQAPEGAPEEVIDDLMGQYMPGHEPEKKTKGGVDDDTGFRMA